MQAFIEHQQQSMQKFMEEASQKEIEEQSILNSNISGAKNKELEQPIDSNLD